MNGKAWAPVVVALIMAVAIFGALALVPQAESVQAAPAAIPTPVSVTRPAGDGVQV